MQIVGGQERKRLRRLDRLVASMVFRLPSTKALGVQCPRYSTQPAHAAEVYALLGVDPASMTKESACREALRRAGVPDDDVTFALIP